MKFTLCLLAVLTVTTLVNAGPLFTSDPVDGDGFVYCQKTYKNVFLLLCPEMAQDVDIDYKIYEFAKICCSQICNIDDVLLHCVASA